MNQAGLHLQRKEMAKAKALLERILKKNPDNVQVKGILKQL
jgi:hypothetical protein